MLACGVCWDGFERGVIVGEFYGAGSEEPCYSRDDQSRCDGMWMTERLLVAAVLLGEGAGAILLMGGIETSLDEVMCDARHDLNVMQTRFKNERREFVMVCCSLDGWIGIKEERTDGFCCCLLPVGVGCAPIMERLTSRKSLVTHTQCCAYFWQRVNDSPSMDTYPFILLTIL